MISTIEITNDGLSTTKTASFVCRVIELPDTFTVLPSMRSIRSRRSVAIRSTTPWSSASSAVRESPSVTNFSAVSTDRPLFSAIPRIRAAYALIVLFSAAVVPVVVISIGVAAPVAVPSAIAAICPESRMNAPAENARLPRGTNTTTGTCEFSILDTISSIDVTSPPGVSSSINTASAPISDA